MVTPKRIDVRPANNLEGGPGSFVVWVYHRKVKIQRLFEPEWGVEAAIEASVQSWRFAMDQL